MSQWHKLNPFMASSPNPSFSNLGFTEESQIQYCDPEGLTLEYSGESVDYNNPTKLLSRSKQIKKMFIAPRRLFKQSKRNQAKEKLRNKVLKKNSYLTHSLSNPPQPATFTPRTELRKGMTNYLTNYLTMFINQ